MTQLDPHTIRACIEALPKANDPLLKYVPSRDVLDQTRAALEALLPDPADESGCPDWIWMSDVVALPDFEPGTDLEVMFHGGTTARGNLYGLASKLHLMAFRVHGVVKTSDLDTVRRLEWIEEPRRASRPKSDPAEELVREWNGTGAFVKHMVDGYAVRNFARWIIQNYTMEKK